VHLFEIVEVKQQYGHQRLTSARTREGAPQALAQEMAIGYTGQGIVGRDMSRLGLGASPLLDLQAQVTDGGLQSFGSLLYELLKIDKSVSQLVRNGPLVAECVRGL